jgi:hypothetical protein
LSTIGDLLNSDKNSTEIILKHFSVASNMKDIIELLNSNSNKVFNLLKFDEVKKIEGSNYGIPLFYFNDVIFSFL